MDSKKNILDYAAQALMIFGLTVASIALCSYFAGDKGREISSLFALGSQGLTLSTLLQIMALAIFITFARFLFFSDGVIKNMSVGARTAGMLISCIAIIVTFILLFDWFPKGQLWPWICFAVSFSLCFTVSYILTIKNERQENRKMAQALEKLKNEEE